MLSLNMRAAGVVIILLLLPSCVITRFRQAPTIQQAPSPAGDDISYILIPANVGAEVWICLEKDELMSFEHPELVSHVLCPLTVGNLREAAARTLVAAR